jgi:glutathione S-transferase
MITFYTNPMSRGQIARWMLHEAGVEYEEVLLDYGTTMKDAAYLAVNPMGKVPAIVDGGAVVTETAAICTYVADRFPSAGLARTEAERADYYRWFFFAAGPLEAAWTARAFGFEPDAKQQVSAGYGNMDMVLQVLSDKFARDDYVCGARFTAADVYLGGQILFGQQFGLIPNEGSFKAYGERLSARPAYIAAKAIDDALIAEAQAG